MKRRPVKIVATIGPASSSSKRVEALLRGGVDVFRFNFAHGTSADHGRRIETIKETASVLGRTVAILQDLPGPRARLGNLRGGRIDLSPGDEVTFAPPGNTGNLPVNLPEFAGLLKPGDLVLLADGSVEVEIVSGDGKTVRGKVINGGMVNSLKGITLPSERYSPEVPTDADRVALRYGLRWGVDLIALSYVDTAEEIREVRTLIDKAGSEASIIVKIETRWALDNLKEIVREADGVMVSRGDLGMELPMEEVPVAQRRVLRRAMQLGKPAIVATQMLGSMTSMIHPTRAEVADIASTVWSGADAVMLSDETAVGDYPEEAVATMDRVINAASRKLHISLPSSAVEKSVDAVARTVCQLADEIGAAAIVAATQSGFTAAMISRLRPACPIIGLTSNGATARRLAVQWGVTPYLEDPYDNVEDMTAKASKAALALKYAAPGDRLVCTAGVPFAQRGGTDLVRVISA